MTLPSVTSFYWGYDRLRGSPVRAALIGADVCTIPVSLAGLPAISIPCGLSEGLPVGLQLAAPAIAENRLLDAAHALEKALAYSRKVYEVSTQTQGEAGKTGGGALVISQFTLFGDARKGRRPSFSLRATGRLIYRSVTFLFVLGGSVSFGGTPTPGTKLANPHITPCTPCLTATNNPSMGL